MKKGLTLVTLLLLITFVLPFSAQARPSYQPQLKPLEGCAACHNNQGGMGPLNSFGEAWVANGKAYNEKIANIDSDGDGFSNAEEITAKTFPGDKESNPGAGPPYLLIFGGIILTAGVVALFVVTVLKAKNREPEEE